MFNAYNVLLKKPKINLSLDDETHIACSYAKSWVNPISREEI